MESTYSKSYGSLQEKLEKEKENLKSVEENIKKIIGRTPSDSARQVRVGLKRNSNYLEPPVTNSHAEVWKSALETSGTGRKPWGRQDKPSGERRGDFEYDIRNGSSKRKSSNGFDQPKTVFSRLSGSFSREPLSGGDTSNSSRRHTISSQIVVTPAEVPSRQEALAKQRVDPNNKERNKRMFGALLGTLRQFKQDETKMKDREVKKAMVEKKLEEAAIKEKEQLKQEREILFKERKLKHIEIRNIELKLQRIKEQEGWETAQRPLSNFIRTKASPHIYYLPKVLTEHTKKLLEDTKKYVANMIEEKRKKVEKEVEEILKKDMDDSFEDGHNIKYDEHGDDTRHDEYNNDKEQHNKQDAEKEEEEDDEDSSDEMMDIEDIKKEKFTTNNVPSLQTNASNDNTNTSDNIMTIQIPTAEHSESTRVVTIKQEKDSLKRKIKEEEKEDRHRKDSDKKYRDEENKGDRHRKDSDKKYRDEEYKEDRHRKDGDKNKQKDLKEKRRDDKSKKSRKREIEDDRKKSKSKKSKKRYSSSSSSSSSSEEEYNVNRKIKIEKENEMKKDKQILQDTQQQKPLEETPIESIPMPVSISFASLAASNFIIPNDSEANGMEG